MSRAEENRVATAFATTGDRKLADCLVNANLRLVVKIVLEYRCDASHVMDLIQEGNCGLVHAVDKFDAQRGIKLGTYASWWIRAYVLKFIMSNARLVKVGTTQDQRRLFFGLRKARAMLERAGGPRVEAKALASVMDVSETAVVEMEQRMSSREASLDAPARDDASETFGATFRADPHLQPDAQCEDSDLRSVLRAHVASFAAELHGRDRDVFDGRIALSPPHTLETLSQKYGVSRERVRQIEARLKGKLRIHLAERMGDSLPTMPVDEDLEEPRYEVSIFVGTAGWAIPRAVADQFPKDGTSLVRYGNRFSAAEINSTFWRRHRPGTLARWRDSVPPDFRFAVKVPRAITHERELRATRPLLRQFLEDIAELKDRLGPLLVQLPPSLAFSRRRAATFFTVLRGLHQGAVVCEARHASWNQPAANALLTTQAIARVAADPPRYVGGDEPAGARSPVYFRLHGSPIVYRSPYGAERLRSLAARLRSAIRLSDVWCIFDNTASGAAAADALELNAILAERH